MKITKVIRVQDASVCMQLLCYARDVNNDSLKNSCYNHRIPKVTKFGKFSDLSV